MKVNWLSILVALVAQQILGFFWHSRGLFAQPWMEGIGKRPADLQPSAGAFILASVAAVLLPLGLAWIFHKTNQRGIKSGALKRCLGYPPLVLAIDASKEIVGCIIVGAIVAAWPRRNAA